VVRHHQQAIQGQLATIEQDYGWAVKIQDRVYRRQNELIYGLLGSTGILRVQLEFYGFCFASTLALPTLLS
jgi:hypothetical protein